MLGMREKLIELLLHDGCPDDGCDFCQYAESEHCRAEIIADRIIANGVTIQQWIPVTERLPEQYKIVIGWDGHFRGEVEHNGEEFVWMDDDDWNSIAEITHWMPLPEPPKGVE